MAPQSNRQTTQGEVMSTTISYVVDSCNECHFIGKEYDIEGEYYICTVTDECICRFRGDFKIPDTCPFK